MRTLPLRLSPVDGESLPGYIARYSHTFQLQPGDVIRALGLDRGTGSVAAAGRYGVSLSADQLKHAAFATGIRTEVLEGMLLPRFVGRAFERSAVTAPIALAGPAQGHQILTRSSRFCPWCLSEDSAWRLRWQVGWSAVCTRHQVVLVRRCPKCEAVSTIARHGRWPRDHRGFLTDPARCSHRRGRELCRGRLTTADAVSVTDELITAQRRIDGLLEGDLQPTLAGVELEPPIYLRDLLTLCNLLDRHARPPVQDAPPAPLLGRRLHDHPAALAAALPEALALADLPDQAALADALRELADRRYRADSQTLVVGKVGPASRTLQRALRQAVSETIWATASSRMGFHPRAHRRPNDLDNGFQARHVPQLFWADDYRRELARLFDFDDFTHWLGRRFCSVLLARMLTPLDWHAAVRYLDFPERFINEGYNTTFAKLRTVGRFDELARRVKSIANHHAQDGLIDYKQRRAKLADWDGIDTQSWYLLQPRPRPLYPHRRVDMPVRRSHASVWLWCQLTSGHERAAPVALPTGNLGHHTCFIRDALPALRERLSLLGELLLATPAEARQTLPTRLAVGLHRHGRLARNFQLDTVDPMIAERVLMHTSAHTGVDIPSLKTPSHQSHAPPAVTHARLLAGALLRTAALASRSAIASTIGGDANHIGDNDRIYRTALDRNPNFAAELARAVENWQTPAPTHPIAPHHERMRDVATAIKARSTELLAASHGPDVARRTSIAVCRAHTDLTCYEIAGIHEVKDAQPAFSRATVAKHHANDPDFERRYRQLLDHARELQRQAGYANANLRRGLTSKPVATRVRTPATGN